jgi:hypothetical protein
MVRRWFLPMVLATMVLETMVLADQDDRQPCFSADQKQFPADH